MASAPDPTDFIKHTDTGLTLLGAPFRFGGADIVWLGLRRDGTAPDRRPTPYEVQDALLTVQAMGGAVVRSVTLAGTAGCALCLEPSSGQFSQDAFAALDLAIKTAGNLGLRLILPLAGSADCAADPASAVCGYAGWGGGGAQKFFSDPVLRAAFAKRVSTILDHVNTLTGIAYHDDPTILAWENCDACGAQADDTAVAAWSEAVGQVVKAHDHLHLYENGAFAGRILPRTAHPVPASAFATPSVDIVGDRGLPPGDTAAIRATVAEAVSTVTESGRVYVLDNFEWGPGAWKTQESLQDFLDAMAKRHALTGALLGGQQGHADSGGYLPPSPAMAGGATPFYFPGFPVPGVSRDEMEQRGRAIRRFNYAMSDVWQSPAYLLPPKPDIISVKGGRVTWRGAAGALDYTIERSPDPRQPQTWVTVCDECTSDANGPWQDPSPSKDPAWYRVMPFNVNGHFAEPSEPAPNH